LSRDIDFDLSAVETTGMNARSERTQCPLCKAGNFLLKFEMERGGQTFKIVSCRECRFVFVADPEADTANHIDIDKIDWAFRSRHFQIRRLLLAHLSAGQQVLEIGCGRGEVGYLLRSDPIQYVAYEPARGLSDFGIRAGIPIVQHTFNGEQTADAIVIDNVLEHVAEPARMLEIAAASLNPGGLLIVITPNLDDIRAISPIWRKRNLWIPPDHINYFSARDIESMFERVGLKARRFKFSPLSLKDWKFFPRAAAEALGLSIFGHNVYAAK
jgi:SAM-dependent methyltransferase